MEDGDTVKQTNEISMVENGCHYVLDMAWQVDRVTIRTGHRPENITRLRRFAIGLIKAKSTPITSPPPSAACSAIPPWF